MPGHVGTAFRILHHTTIVGNVQEIGLYLTADSDCAVPD
jgi:hypothetical protein